MKKALIILGFIASIITILLAITPLSKLAFFPGSFALIFGVLAFYLSKGESRAKRTIQLSLLITIIALALTTYKSIFNTASVGDTKELLEKEAESEEEAIKELEELDIEDIDLE